MSIPSDQTHFIHTIEHLAAARRELWEAVNDQSSKEQMTPVFESIDDSIRRIASVIR
jgi:hypothetical protein